MSPLIRRSITPLLAVHSTSAPFQPLADTAKQILQYSDVRRSSLQPAFFDLLAKFGVLRNVGYFRKQPCRRGQSRISRGQTVGGPALPWK